MNIMEATRLALSGQLEVDSNSVLTESIERPKKLINNNLKKENVEIKADNTEIKIDDDETEIEIHPDDKKCDVCPECGCNPCVCDKEDDAHDESDKEADEDIPVEDTSKEEPKEDTKSVLEAKADKILEDEEKPGNAYAQPNGTITDSKTGEILDPGVVEESDDKEKPDEGEIPEEDSVEEKSDDGKSDKEVELPSIDVDINKVKEAAKILDDIINAVDDKEKPEETKELSEKKKELNESKKSGYIIFIKDDPNGYSYQGHGGRSRVRLDMTDALDVYDTVEQAQKEVNTYKNPKKIKIMKFDGKNTTELNESCNKLIEETEPEDKEESKKIVKESWDAQPDDPRVHASRVVQLVDEGLVSWEDIGKMLVNTLMSDYEVSNLLRDDLYEMTDRDIDDDSDDEDNDLDESKNISLSESRILTHKRIIKEALKRKQNENK